jgi:hypothetical protein
MNKHRLLVAAALVITLGGVQLSYTQGRKATADPQQPRTLFLEGYLLQVGEKYDLYFTLETAWMDGEPSNWMESYKLKSPPKLDGIQRDLERLRMTVPNFTYNFDQANPKVIHIVDARLLGREAYGLDSQVNNIDYKGPLPGLVTALGERGINVSTARLMSIGDMRPRDNSTEVHVTAQNITVRDAITHFTPLEGRRRIMWDAATNLTSGGVSQIQFYGSTGGK